MTNLRGIKKGLITLLCLTMILSTSTGFAYQTGFGDVYYQSSKEIFTNVDYTEIEGYHPANGIEHAYVIQADAYSNSLKPIVFNGEVRATYTLASMIKYTEERGYKVLAAINGDIFDTSTGVPKGMSISSGNIITSGYAPEMSLAFDEEGNASMQEISMVYGLKGKVTEDKPATTSTEENPAENNETTDAPENTESTTPTEEPASSPEPEQVVSAETGAGIDFYTVIGFFNVPQGGAKGLHLYNRHYSKATRTSGNCVEVVIDTGNSNNIQLKVNGSIKGIVKSVKTNTFNTPIGETEVVLSAVMDSSSASTLEKMVVGSEVEITATDLKATGLEDTVEAVGIYYSIVKDGKVDTTGTNLNPRTAVGIKEDGSLVFYVLDGRQPAVSNGLGLIDTARHMIDLGCVSAFNMDGGGSSTLYARLPGYENSATIKNSPSQLSLRSISNGILLVYKDTTDSQAKNLHLYPDLTLMMPGAEAQITTYASNSLYEKVKVPGAVSYSVSKNNGTITMDGIYTAGTDPGRVIIEASSGQLRGSTEVEIVHPSNLIYSASVSKLNVDINQTADINMIVKTGISRVNSKDSLFQWSCDPEIGTIDGEGKFVSSLLNGQKGNIYIGYNGSKITIPVTVGSEIVDFLDTKLHWAREYIGKMAARGLIAGVGDNMYMPDANITRAQFLAMLAKTVSDVNLDSFAATGFSDVPQNEWYYKYVNWGYANSIVSGLDDKTFAPNANITREQMTIMLCNFSRAQGIAIPQVTSGTTYPDSTTISPWAADYVATVVGGGIMNGDSTGYFMPQGMTTRAQAVKVVYVYTNIKDGIE